MTLSTVNQKKHVRITCNWYLQNGQVILLDGQVILLTLPYISTHMFSPFQRWLLKWTKVSAATELHWRRYHPSNSLVLEVEANGWSLREFLWRELQIQGPRKINTTTNNNIQQQPTTTTTTKTSGFQLKPNWISSSNVTSSPTPHPPGPTQLPVAAEQTVEREPR